MNGERPFFSPGDPLPEIVNDPDDPLPEIVNDPDDPLPEIVNDPDDPLPEIVNDPDDPLPEIVNDPDDPEVAYALGVLRGRLIGRRRRPQPRRRRGGTGGPPPVNLEPTGNPVHYSGYLIVRLAGHLDLERADGADTLGELAKKLKLRGLLDVLRRHRLSRYSSRLVDLEEKELEGEECQENYRPRSLRELEREAARSMLPPLHSLVAYWRIDVRDQVGKDKPEDGEVWNDGWEPSHESEIEKILTQLNELVEVDRAYRELAVTDPQAVDSDYGGVQEYLDRAPVGIDARWASEQAEGRGEGTALVDLEQGWVTQHQDFAGRALSLIYGDNRHGHGEYRGHHGSAVLGEIVAAADGIGVVGIAPGVASVRLASHYDASTNESLNVAAAIRQAYPKMNPGDVLLLEVQRSFLPTEVDDADFDAIRLAVAHGVIVIEAAGNGEADLDRYLDEWGDRILHRRSQHFRESGAIMVAAARADRPHDRFAGPVGVGSNYGSRIDCFAFGDRVATAGYGDLAFDETGDEETAARRAFTGNFGGTSGAAPIITGAALVVQGMHEARCGVRLTPFEMREILSDPRSGTPHGRGVDGYIGVMPNLRAILENRLQLAPDVYLRDRPGDDGAVPALKVGGSPDVIVVDREMDSARFAEGGGLEDAYVGGRCAAGADHLLYLRLRNRGAAAAASPEATVYWSPVATLATPDLWQPIATRRLSTVRGAVNVPAGDTLTVSDPIPWPAGDVQRAMDGLAERGLRRPPETSAHLCFVAIVRDPGSDDPLVPPGRHPYFRWRQFRTFLRDHNNVAIRNVHLLDPQPASGLAELPFLITGTPDLARRFDFQIVQRLPSGATVTLDVPAPLAAPLRQRRLWRIEALEGGRQGRLHLPPRPRVDFARVRLVAGARHVCRFRVSGAAIGAGHSLAIRQLYRGEEIGQITWRFGPREP